LDFRAGHAGAKEFAPVRKNIHAEHAYSVGIAGLSRDNFFPPVP
jgi:hypothetical protein